MSYLKDLTGDRFFRLTVLYRTKNKVYNRKNKKVSKTTWHCICDCGTEIDVVGESLKQGLTKSCGCWNDECRKNPSIKCHTSNTLDWRKDSEYNWLYERYRGILRRCGYCSNQENKNYKGRNIKVDSLWLEDYNNFKIWALNNGAQKDLTIDRIDVNGNYEPNNCRWITCKIQQRNKTNNRLVEYKGKLLTLAELAENHNIDYRLLRERIIKQKWSVERAVSTPKLR